MEPKYPGSDQDLADAARVHNLVFIGTFEDLGKPTLGPPGTTRFSDAVINIDRGLSGDETETLRCSFFLRTFPEAVAESIPTEGKDYLIVGNLDADGFRITKVVEPTRTHLDKIGEVLRERGVKMGPSKKETVGTVPTDDKEHTKGIPDRKEGDSKQRTPDIDNGRLWGVIVGIMFAIGVAVAILLSIKRK